MNCRIGTEAATLSSSSGSHRSSVTKRDCRLPHSAIHHTCYVISCFPRRWQQPMPKRRYHFFDPCSVRQNIFSIMNPTEIWKGDIRNRVKFPLPQAIQLSKKVQHRVDPYSMIVKSITQKHPFLIILIRECMVNNAIARWTNGKVLKVHIVLERVQTVSKKVQCYTEYSRQMLAQVANQSIAKGRIVGHAELPSFQKHKNDWQGLGIIQLAAYTFRDLSQTYPEKGLHQTVCCVMTCNSDWLSMDQAIPVWVMSQCNSSIPLNFSCCHLGRLFLKPEYQRQRSEIYVKYPAPFASMAWKTWCFSFSWRYCIHQSYPFIDGKDFVSTQFPQPALYERVSQFRSLKKANW